MPKKVKPINFIVPLQVYPFDVMISIGQSDNQLAKILEATGNVALTENDYLLCKYTSENCQARAVMFSTNASIIRLRHLPSTGSDFATLAHEIFHIVTFVMDRVGMKLEIMVSDEAYAYLIGYLTTEIYKETNKYY